MFLFVFGDILNRKEINRYNFVRKIFSDLLFYVLILVLEIILKLNNL